MITASIEVHFINNNNNEKELFYLPYLLTMLCLAGGNHKNGLNGTWVEARLSRVEKDSK